MVSWLAAMLLVLLLLLLVWRGAWVFRGGCNVRGDGLTDGMHGGMGEDGGTRLTGVALAWVWGVWFV